MNPTRPYDIQDSDASFMLSAVLEERRRNTHAARDQASERLASDLLRFECWAGLRQAASAAEGLKLQTHPRLGDGAHEESRG